MTKNAPFVLHTRTITATGGGPDKTILNSHHHLTERGYNSACLFLHPPKDRGFHVLRDRARAMNTPLIEVEDRSRFDFKALKNTINHCKLNNVDIWHAHDYKTNLIGLIVKKFHPMKLITTTHGWDRFDGGLPRYFKWDKKWFLPRYERVICVSENVRSECIQAGLAKSSCPLIENAIDTAQFKRLRTVSVAKSEDFGIQDCTQVIGSIGRLSEEKGFDLLIDAACRLLHEGAQIRLVIAGEGPIRNQLETQIAESGFSKHIQLVGFRQDTRAFYEGLDTFVLSSHREGLPNVLLEAMAVGTPVLATRVGGVERVVQQNENGLLIEPGSSEQIYAGLKQLMNSAEQRQKFSQRGLASVTKHWSFSKRMDAIVKVYEEVLRK